MPARRGLGYLKYFPFPLSQVYVNYYINLVSIKKIGVEVHAREMMFTRGTVEDYESAVGCPLDVFFWPI